MSLTVLIGTNDVTQYVLAGSVSVKLASDGEVGTASVRLSEPSALFPGPLSGLGSILSLHEPLVVSVDGTTIFRGYISSVTREVEPAIVRYSVSAQDLTIRLKRIILMQRSYTSTTAGAIVGAMIAEAAGVLNPSTEYVLDTTPVDSWEVRYQSVADVLQTLAQATKATWYVDPDGKLHWRPLSSPEASGLAFGPQPTDEGILAGSLRVDSDMSALANKITVIAREASYSTGQNALNPPADSDDGTVVAQDSATWPPSTGDSASTTGNLTVRASRQGTPTQTNSSYADASGSTVLTGASWPPSTSGPLGGATAERSYDSGTYTARLGYVRIPTPNLNGPVTGLKLRITIADKVDGTDSIQYLMVGQANSSNWQQASADWTGETVGVTFSDGLNEIDLDPDWYVNDGYVYLRIGWLGPEAPSAVNSFSLTNAYLVIDYLDESSMVYSAAKAHLRFDTSALGGTPTGATLRLKCAAKSSTRSLYIRQSNVAWPLDATDWSASGGTSLAIVAAASITAGSWLEVSIPASAIDTSGYSEFELEMVSPDAPTAAHEVSFYGQSSTGNEPELIVFWEQSSSAISATAYDSDSIAAYGERSLVIVDASLTQQQCQQVADRELALRALPVLSLSLQALDQLSLRPTQQISIDFSQAGVSGDYVVKSAALTVLANGHVKCALDLATYRYNLLRYLSGASGATAGYTGGVLGGGSSESEIVTFLLAATIEGLDNPGLSAGAKTAVRVVQIGGTVESVTLYFGTAPSSNDVVIDVRRNGTSIFSGGGLTYEQDRTTPKRVTSGFVSSPLVLMAGDVLTVYVATADANAKDGILHIVMR